MKRSALFLFRVPKARFIAEGCFMSCFATRFMHRKVRFIEKSTCISKCFFLAPPTGLEPCDKAHCVRRKLPFGKICPCARKRAKMSLRLKSSKKQNENGVRLDSVSFWLPLLDLNQ